MGLIGKPIELMEDQTGLKHTSKITKTSLGQDVLMLVQDEVITEQSIGYDEIDSEFDEATGTNILKEIRLWEMSLVTWGANQVTPITNLKGQSSEDVLKLFSDRFYKMQDCFRNGEWNSKEAPHMVEISLKRLSPMLKALQDAQKTDKEIRYQQQQDSSKQLLASFKKSLERVQENVLEAVTALKGTSEDEKIDDEANLDLSSLQKSADLFSLGNLTGAEESGVDSYLEDVSTRLQQFKTQLGA